MLGSNKTHPKVLKNEGDLAALDLMVDLTLTTLKRLSQKTQVSFDELQRLEADLEYLTRAAEEVNLNIERLIYDNAYYVYRSRFISLHTLKDRKFRA